MQTIIKHTYGFITRLVNGSLTPKDLCIIFTISLAVLGLFMALKGQTGQWYYSDNN